MEGIKLVLVEAVLMPNKEIICVGKSLGFVGDGENQIPAKFVKEPRTLVAEVSGGVLTDLHGLPEGWDYEIADWDEEDMHDQNTEMVERAKAL